jgi:histone H3/H4
MSSALRKQSLLCLAAVVLATTSAFADIKGKITKELVEAAVSRAAKRSGRKLIDPAAHAVVRETAERIAKKYGDEALLTVQDAGLELLEAVPKFGDEVVEFAMKASPEGRFAFARNVPELLPLARRVGLDAIELEAKSPGLSLQVFKVFGDDAGKVIARRASPDDVPRLLKYAESADSPETRELLLEAYEREGKNLFERIPPRLVLASGLTASMLYGTHRAAGTLDGLAEKLKPGDLVPLIVCGAIVLLVVIVLLLWRFGLMPWHRRSLSAAKTRVGRK